MELFLRAILFALVVALGMVSSYALAAHFFKQGVVKRLLSTLVLFHGQLYAVFFVLSFFHLFTGLWVSVVALALFAGLLWRLGKPCRAQASFDLQRVVEAVRPTSSTWPVLVFLALAGIALSISALYILFFPTWSWDCVWYHSAQSRYALQERSIHYWSDNPVGYINGYPRLVEAFAAWTIGLLKTDVLDDGSQFLWAITGMLAVTGLGRRLGLGPVLSFCIGLSWLCLPAVALQIHTTHADVSAGALYIAFVYYLLAAPSPASTAMAWLCAGLLLSTKVSGVVLVALLSPWALVQGLRALRGSERFGFAHVLVLAAGLVFLVAQPLRNTVRTKNPLFPATLRIPFTQLVLPGQFEEGAVAGGLGFLRSPNALANIWAKWRAKPGAPFPDVRENPFGRSFLYGTLPLSLLGLLFALWKRSWAVLGLLAMAAASMMLPASWWGRFVLSVPAVAAVLSGLLLQALTQRWRWLGSAALLVFAVAVANDLYKVRAGYRQLSGLLWPASRAAAEDALRQEMSWMWPRHVIEARDRELLEGDTLAHDESVEFFGELWNTAATSRVVFVSSRGAVGSYLQRLEQTGAKWVSISVGSPAAAALMAAGWQPIATHRFGHTELLRRAPAPPNS